jgi:hypothetical protein
MGLALAVPIGGAILGYKLLAGRFPFAGAVGVVGGFLIVPKVVSPILGPILKPFAEKALADAKAAGFTPPASVTRLSGCTTCG